MFGAVQIKTQTAVYNYLLELVIIFFTIGKFSVIGDCANNKRATRLPSRWTKNHMVTSSLNVASESSAPVCNSNKTAAVGVMEHREAAGATKTSSLNTVC